MKPNHDGIKQMAEQEAAELFELADIQDAADTVARHFLDADMTSGKAQVFQREAHRLWMEAAAMTQAEGGRLRKVEGNEAMAEALLASAQSEATNCRGERVWAEVAAKYGAYVSHGRRLELVSAEKPGQVYCYDVDEHEMAIHPADGCPNGTLHHSTATVTMLRRRNSRGRLALWPGRREG